MDYNILSWLKASEYRQKVLIALYEEPKTPKELSEETEYYLSHVSTTLSRLEDKGLTKCLTPERRKGKLFKTTKKGNNYVDYLKE